MPSGYYTNVYEGLLLLVFHIAIGAILLRFLLHWVRADVRFNQAARSLINITNPLIVPLRRYIPGFMGIDWASIVLILLMAIFVRTLIVFLDNEHWTLVGLLILAAAEILTVVYHLLLFAIFLSVLASWIAPCSGNPVVELADTITDPLLRPIRRVFPPLGGMDFSCYIACIFLYLTSALLIVPLEAFGYQLMM